MTVFFRIRKSSAFIAFLLFVIAVLSIVLIFCWSRDAKQPTSSEPASNTQSPSPSGTSSAPPGTPSAQKKTFSIGGKRETQKGTEILDNFKKIGLGKKEKATGAEISEDFKKIKLVNKEKSTAKRIWRTPPGEQPGTLVVPDVEVGGAPSDVRYNSTMPFSLLGGTRTGPFPGHAVSSGADLGPPRENSMAKRREREVVMELGTTQHSFDKSNNLEDGITGETWTGDRNDWDVQKVQVKQVMLDIMPKFDEMLSEIWKDEPLSEEAADNGQFSVRTPKGACISLDRYYEFVQANVNAQMGSPFKKPDWMKGAALDLGFANLEKSKAALKELLIQPCDEAKFSVDASDSVLKNGVPLQVKVPWPRDGSTLFVHNMKKK